MRVVSGGRGFLVITGSKPDSVRALYGSGAWLVVPALEGGCGFRNFSRRLVRDSSTLIENSAARQQSGSETF